MVSSTQRYLMKEYSYHIHTHLINLTMLEAPRKCWVDRQLQWCSVSG